MANWHEDLLAVWMLDMKGLKMPMPKSVNLTTISTRNCFPANNKLGQKDRRRRFNFVCCSLSGTGEAPPILVKLSNETHESANPKYLKYVVHCLIKATLMRNRDFSPNLPAGFVYVSKKSLRTSWYWFSHIDLCLNGLLQADAAKEKLPNLKSEGRLSIRRRTVRDSAIARLKDSRQRATL